MNTSLKYLVHCLAYSVNGKDSESAAILTVCSAKQVCTSGTHLCLGFEMNVCGVSLHTVAHSLRNLFLSSRNPEPVSPSPSFHLVEHLNTGSAGPYFAETRTPEPELLKRGKLRCRRLIGKRHGGASLRPPPPTHTLRLKGGGAGKTADEQLGSCSNVSCHDLCLCDECFPRT